LLILIEAQRATELPPTEAPMGGAPPGLLGGWGGLRPAGTGESGY
jgi:hypothetical protein